ncbi:PIN domain-containing protein [Beggiatoa alba]|nr:PIN domain-containing protein [Beggiatoa alba]MBN4069121.1 PIN domain-containing protein [Beggiatoa alba]
MKKALIDSGPLIALFNRNDRYHIACVEFIKANRSELVTTIASITETLHLLDFNRNAQVDFLSWINAGAVTIEPIAADDLFSIKELIIKYSDLPMDFADACLVFLGDKLNINSIVTIDRDFDVYRLKGKRPFTILIK